MGRPRLWGKMEETRKWTLKEQKLVPELCKEERGYSSYGQLPDWTYHLGYKASDVRDFEPPPSPSCIDFQLRSHKVHRACGEEGDLEPNPIFSICSIDSVSINSLPTRFSKNLTLLDNKE